MIYTSNKTELRSYQERIISFDEFCW